MTLSKLVHLHFYHNKIDNNNVDYYATLTSLLVCFFTYIVVKQGAKFSFYNVNIVFVFLKLHKLIAGYLFSLLDGYNFDQQNLSLLMGNWHIKTK